jgi:hypothetical protein
VQPVGRRVAPDPWIRLPTSRYPFLNLSLLRSFWWIFFAIAVEALRLPSKPGLAGCVESGRLAQSRGSSPGALETLPAHS